MSNSNEPPLPEEGQNESPETTRQYTRLPEPPRLQRSTVHKVTSSGGRSPKHVKETKIGYHLRQRGVTVDRTLPKKHLGKIQTQLLSGQSTRRTNPHSPRAVVDSLVLIHLSSRIDHKLCMVINRLNHRITYSNTHHSELALTTK